MLAYGSSLRKMAPANYGDFMGTEGTEGERVALGLGANPILRTGGVVSVVTAYQAQLESYIRSVKTENGTRAGICVRKPPIENSAGLLINGGVMLSDAALAATTSFDVRFKLWNTSLSDRVNYRDLIYLVDTPGFGDYNTSSTTIAYGSGGGARTMAISGAPVPVFVRLRYRKNPANPTEWQVSLFINGSSPVTLTRPGTDITANISEAPKSYPPGVFVGFISSAQTNINPGDEVTISDIVIVDDTGSGNTLPAGADWTVLDFESKVTSMTGETFWNLFTGPTDQVTPAELDTVMNQGPSYEVTNYRDTLSGATVGYNSRKPMFANKSAQGVVLTTGAEVKYTVTPTRDMLATDKLVGSCSIYMVDSAVSRYPSLVDDTGLLVGGVHGATSDITPTAVSTSGWFPNLSSDLSAAGGRGRGSIKIQTSDKFLGLSNITKATVAGVFASPTNRLSISVPKASAIGLTPSPRRVDPVPMEPVATPPVI